MKHLGTILLLCLLTSCRVFGGSTQVRWYGGEKYNGKKTASGETFYDSRLRFASNSLPFGTRVEVTYDGKTAIVTCNDRGPNKIELTKFAFEFLADPAVGVLNVQYKILTK